MKKNLAAGLVLVSLILAFMPKEQQVKKERRTNQMHIGDTVDGYVIDTMLCVDESSEKIERMAWAFAQVESRNNPNAVSKTEDCVGWLQLSKIMVDEANRVLGWPCFTYDARYNQQESLAIFHVIMDAHNPQLDIDRAVDIWNPGCGRTYREQVKHYYKEACNG